VGSANLKVERRRHTADLRDMTKEQVGKVVDIDVRDGLEVGVLERVTGEVMTNYFPLTSQSLSYS
jgi:hypothetical protein